jgi:hypothetical protein
MVSCVNPPARMGMVKNPQTGLQYGSVVERNLVTDSSFYANKKIKIRIRNTSGDVAFDLGDFSRQLRAAYVANGYTPTQGDDFGLLIDVNVMYSGQMQTNLAKEFTFLGAAGGGLSGAAISNSDAIGTTGGVFAGAVFGNILGSYITDDTYVIVSRVTFAEIKDKAKSSKSISFSRSPKHRYEEEDRESQKSTRGFKNTYSTGVSVFAGGRNVPQSHIAGEVKSRIIRIVSNII